MTVQMQFSIILILQKTTARSPLLPCPMERGQRDWFGDRRVANFDYPLRIHTESAMKTTAQPPCISRLSDGDLYELL